MTMIELISTGASAAVVALTVLVISLRLRMYSASLAPHFRRLSAGWKGLLSYLLTDPAYAVSITRFDGGGPGSQTSAGISSAQRWWCGSPGR